MTTTTYVTDGDRSGATQIVHASMWEQFPNDEAREAFTGDIEHAMRLRLAARGVSADRLSWTNAMVAREGEDEPVAVRVLYMEGPAATV